MELILDANEYIFALGLMKKETCTVLFEQILKNISDHHIHICRTIVDEIRQNLSLDEFREFILFINPISTIDEDFFVPFILGEKYMEKGLKPADAFIAAYTEWTGADVLVTENRHFLTLHDNLPFKILSAEKCFKLLK